MLTSSVISWRQFLCNKVMSKNPKKRGKLMRTANIIREFLHIFGTTWPNSIKISEMMCFKIILKVTKNQGFTLSLEDTFSEKPQEGQIEPPPPSLFRVKGEYLDKYGLHINNIDTLILTKSLLSGAQASWHAKNYSINAEHESLLNINENHSIMPICQFFEHQVASSDYSLSGLSGYTTQNIETPNKHSVLRKYPRCF